MTDFYVSTEQFQKERELASMIRSASPEHRDRAYQQAYSEFYRLFPAFEQNDSMEESRVKTTLAFLERFIRGSRIVIEVGAGHCYLAEAVAKHASLVVALDVAPLVDSSNFPSNLRHQVYDGKAIPVDANSADLVLSDNVLEHLHPDDALPQVDDMVRTLKTSGYIVILTPNKTNGPHDGSAGFTVNPEGLHLHEYTSLEIKRLLLRAGCKSVRAYIGAKGKYVAILPEIAAVVEWTASLFPRRFLRQRNIRWLLPNRFSAQKA
ncbi:SAM-dependent methyltransferase [Bradyrhizobium sp. USDA 4449]